MPPKKAHVAPYHIRTFALSEANAKWVREQSTRTNRHMSAIVNEALDMLRDVRAIEAPVSEVSR